MDKISEKAHVRLELLKLTYNNVHSIPDILIKTKQLEEFVLEKEVAPAKEELPKENSDRPAEKMQGNSGPKKPGNKNEDKSLFS